MSHLILVNADFSLVDAGEERGSESPSPQRTTQAIVFKDQILINFMTTWQVV